MGGSEGLGTRAAALTPRRAAALEGGRRSWSLRRFRWPKGSRPGAKGRAWRIQSTRALGEAVRGWKGGRRRCRAARTAHLAGVRCADLGSGL